MNSIRAVSYTQLDVYKRQAGHINPALAIAGALKKADPTAEIHFAGRKEGMESVSYTHLDVYKRQVRAPARSSGR